MRSTQTTTAQAEPPAGAARPAGRPRSAKAEQAIIEATLDLIGEGLGVSALSMEAVAARAGVGKTTIYRRWARKEDLIVDALTTLKAPMPPIEGVSVRDDLITYLTVIMEEGKQTRARCIMNIALSEAERNPEIAMRFQQAAIEPRRAAMRAVFERGIATGVIRPDCDVDLAMAMFSGTMMWQTRWIHRHYVEREELPARIVDMVLDGIRPLGAASTSLKRPEDA
ncbi:DNA-binding transcriptional regulator, AcrR family [Sinosporangium album]|uniref:DNA-binding transcriptional regulator, AcrR family n=1 Tax=Sinosporangium album TaxID=504805 RepID=A0A1G7SIT7_9ACTN|nr:TetR/AcrR family transcriptional regulator [Sinosporangium album]SDG22913.1 DNA-binding transcriptional regulator, AcrR family [Sinosporangium album]